MQSKEVKKWQDEEALKRYQMIAPLLDEDLDEEKRRQLREEIAEKYGISKRSLYRYEAKYREEAFDGLRPMNREKRRSQALPENYDEIVGEAIQLKRGVPKRSVRQIIKMQEVYEAAGKEFIPYEQNYELQQMVNALVQQGTEEIFNITRSTGFMVDDGHGGKIFAPLSEVYNSYLDNAITGMASGAYDYNTMIRKTVNQMTASGLRTDHAFSDGGRDYGVDYASGHHNRIDVAARRALLTGFGQLTGHVTDLNAREATPVKWLKDIGATGTTLDTLDKYKEARHNNTEEYQLLRGYGRAVEKGDVSALVGLEQYKKTAADVRARVVGQTTTDGVKIESYATHFIDRVIGQTAEPHEGMREATSIEAVNDAMANPEKITERTLADGDVRRTYKGAGAFVTVSVRDNRLIQANPRGGQK